MSTKAMGRLYTPSGGGMSAGGAGGFGQTKRLSMELQAQRQNLLTQLQSDRDFATLQNELESKKMEHEAALKKTFADSEAAQRLADKYNISKEDLGKLTPILANNAVQEQSMRGKSLARPEAQNAMNTGVDALNSGMNPNRVINVPEGGMAAYQMPQGGMGTLQGPLKNQELEKDAWGGLHPRISNVPGGMTLPIPPGAKDAASQLPPPSPMPTQGGTEVNPSPFGAVDPRFGGGNMLGAGIAPIPANAQNMSGSFTRTGVNAMPGAGGIPPNMAGMGAPNPASGPVSANPGMLPNPAMGQSNQAAIEAQRKAQIMQMIMQQIQQQGAIRPPDDMEGAGQTNPEDYAPYGLDGRPHYAQ